MLDVYMYLKTALSATHHVQLLLLLNALVLSSWHETPSGNNLNLGRASQRRITLCARNTDKASLIEVVGQGMQTVHVASVYRREREWIRQERRRGVDGCERVKWRSQKAWAVVGGVYCAGVARLPVTGVGPPVCCVATAVVMIDDRRSENAVADNGNKNTSDEAAARQRQRRLGLQHVQSRRRIGHETTDPHAILRWPVQPDGRRPRPSFHRATWARRAEVSPGWSAWKRRRQ